MALINSEKYSLYYQRISLFYQRPEVKASLEVILSVFTVAILVFAAIRPTLTNIAALQKKITDLESVDKKADNKINQIFNAQKQLEEFQSKLPLYDAAVPDNFSYYDMAGRIEALAKRRGLSVETITMPGARLFGTDKPVGDWAAKISEKDASNIVQASVSFSVSGKPNQIRDFLIDVESMDRLTLLTNIALTAGVTAGRGQELKASGLIYFYFYQQS